ncbi:AAC(3) family N-acetyltransferase [Streptomyces sp. NPDC051219]|uniref:AAC(3) family N-acetyltransferase n=1 Tax=Streptomyces sp. NPDC051219 TaxID=3155283 RepID=UPI0034276FF2
MLAHASLHNTGLRPSALREALLEVLGEDGTLMVPTFTPENSASSSAHLARVQGMTGEQIRAFRATMPAFDPERTPSQGMGRLAESVRTAPGAVRSTHPQTSFAALGRSAKALLADHEQDCHLGEASPLGAMFREGGQVLMVNVGFAVCSAFHLAEYRIPFTPLREYRCVVNLRGRAVWVAYKDVELDDSDFAEIGAAFPGSEVRTGQLGGTTAMLFSIKEAVDHAVAWMTQNRR